MNKYKLPKTLPGSTQLTCCLDTKMVNTLDKIALSRYVRTQTIIDLIINKFVMTYEDKAFFITGDEPKSFVDTIKGLVYQPPERQFVTYLIRDRSYKRIDDYKQEYGLSRSKILKHIIVKYLKENYYVET